MTTYLGRFAVRAFRKLPPIYVYFFPISIEGRGMGSDCISFG